LAHKINKENRQDLGSKVYHQHTSWPREFIFSQVATFFFYIIRKRSWTISDIAGRNSGSRWKK